MSKNLSTWFMDAPSFAIGSISPRYRLLPQNCRISYSEEAQLTVNSFQDDRVVRTIIG